MNFVKMHGIGNDYVYIDCFSEVVEDPQTLALQVSDRHKGVGSDGLVLILPSDKAHVRMRMFNSDGSESQMCGNAIRCVGKYAYEHKLVRDTTMTVETLAGVKTLWLHEQGGRIPRVTVDMGSPEWRPAHIPVEVTGKDALHQSVTVAHKLWEVHCVSMGNPHAVIFSADVTELPVHRLGPLFEHHPLFPERINTEFAEVRGPGEIYMRVWERGAGETQACGTGACAVVVTAARLGFTGRTVAVGLLGGVLDIDWRNDDHVYMTGDAVAVFEGRLF